MVTQVLATLALRRTSCIIHMLIDANNKPFCPMISDLHIRTRGVLRAPPLMTDEFG
jgi:hypothetical protein